MGASTALLQLRTHPPHRRGRKGTSINERKRSARMHGRRPCSLAHSARPPSFLPNALPTPLSLLRCLTRVPQQSQLCFKQPLPRCARLGAERSSTTCAAALRVERHLLASRRQHLQERDSDSLMSPRTETSSETQFYEIEVRLTDSMNCLTFARIFRLLAMDSSSLTPPPLTSSTTAVWS